MKRPPVLLLLSVLALIAALCQLGCGRSRITAENDENGTGDSASAWPLLWHIGQIDPRFNMTRTDLRFAVERAAGLWDKAAGKQVFAYSPNGGFTIDLVYDERQQLVSAESDGKSELSLSESAIQVAKERERDALAHYQSARQEFNAEEAEYNEAVARHNSQVDSWSAGEAPPEVASKLNNEVEALAEQKSRVQAEEQQVEALRVRANALVSRFNRLVANYNLQVEKFNAQFGKGILQQVGSCRFEGQRTVGITVYAFTTPENLEIVLAHELGHAFGLRHVKGDGAIMSAVENGEKQSVRLELTQRDVAALDSLLRTRELQGAFTH